MRGLLDDAAGGPRSAVLPLRQVGQGHGGVDLPPVRLVFALHLLFLRSSDATAAADDQRNAQACRGKHKTERGEVRGQVQPVMNEMKDEIWEEKVAYLSHLLDPCSVVSESTRGEKRLSLQSSL